MDLVSIALVLWRYKKLVVPVIVLTAVAGFYVVKVKPPVYEVGASILLTNPQTGATQSQIQENPDLKRVNPYNTFVSYGNLNVVANAVMDLVTSPASAESLLKAGVGPGYEISLSTDYGNPPIIEINGIGPSAQNAIQSANALASVVKKDLYQIQKAQGVNPFYMITGYELVRPFQAQTSSSGKSRSLIALLAAGALLILVVVSVADALGKRRSTADALAAQPSADVPAANLADEHRPNGNGSASADHLTPEAAPDGGGTQRRSRDRRPAHSSRR